MHEFYACMNFILQFMLRFLVKIFIELHKCAWGKAGYIMLQLHSLKLILLDWYFSLGYGTKYFIGSIMYEMLQKSGERKPPAMRGYKKRDLLQG